MLDRHVCLIGLSGCGKSTVGRQAADALGLPFVDLDEEIAREARLPVSEIFARFGEETFRNLEADFLRLTLARSPHILATGGGAVLRAENVERMRRHGLVVYLERDPARIADTIPFDGARPLARTPGALFALAQARRPLYQAAAHVTIPSDESVSDVLRRFTALLYSEDPPAGFAVIGSPIDHSLSPILHRIVFDRFGAHDAYHAIHVPRHCLVRFVDRMRRSALVGFNVTVPHKHAILPLLDTVDDEARRAGAVNTVLRRGDRLHGTNTDMDGLLAALRGAGHDYRGRRVAILGAGGAAAGAAYKAVSAGARGVVVLSRDAAKACALAHNLRTVAGTNGGCEILSDSMTPGALENAARTADLLIQATPLGMQGFGADYEDLSFLRRLPPGALVCDLVYAPPKTRFLQEAEKYGYPTLGGLSMLIHQALRADALFLGREIEPSEDLLKTLFESVT